MKILWEEGNLDASERIKQWWAPERYEMLDIGDYDS